MTMIIIRMATGIPVYENYILHKGAITSLLCCARGDVTKVVDVTSSLKKDKT